MASESALQALPLITTKFNPAIRGGLMVGRPRLMNRLSAGRGCKLTVVTAPPGFGKTSVLGQWRQLLLDRGEEVGWLGLDAADNDPARFFSYVVAAIRTRLPEFGEAVATLLDSNVGVPPAAVTATLINAIDALDRDFTLILDDYHFITDPATEDAAGRLVLQSGPRLRLIIASREAPRLPLGRLRALRQLAELSGADLQFSTEEAAEYVAHADLGAISAKDIEALNERTEGWVAGLQLASIALRGHADPGAFIRSFSGNHRTIADFLADDVLRRQSEEVRDFLLATSVLPRLCPSLCDAVTGRDDGPVMLRRLEDSNLFIFPLDDERSWYRYHHLFSDFLRRRLREQMPARSEALCRRASDWFAEQGLLVEAIDLALAAGDRHRAAELLDAASESLFTVGQLATIEDYAARLPADMLRRFPRLQLDRIWAFELGWRFGDARQILADTLAAIEEMAAGRRVRPEGLDLDYLRAKAKHRELMMALLSDDVAANLRLSREWLDLGLTDEPYLKASTQSSLLYARREFFDLKGALDEAPSVRERYLEGKAVYGTIWHDCIVGPIQVAAGLLGEAEATYRRAFDAAVRLNGREAPVTAMPALLLAEVCYEQNRLEEAREWLEDYLPLAGQIGFVDQLIAGHVFAARLAFVDGKPDAARDILDKGGAIAVARGFDRLQANLSAERLRQLLAAGDVNGAQRLARTERMSGPAEEFLPASGVTSRHETLALGRARLALATGEIADAGKLLRRWHKFVDDRGFKRSAVRFGLLLAVTAQLEGDVPAAQRHLRHALAAGARGRMIRNFLDEGRPIHGLVAGLCAEAIDTQDPAIEFGRRVLAACDGGAGPDALAAAGDGLDEGPALTAPLQAREIEILRLAGTGLANHEIGNQLGLTAGTVKWYMQQVFAKLGVHRRSRAVGRARQLGLIP